MSLSRSLSKNEKIFIALAISKATYEDLKWASIRLRSCSVQHMHVLRGVQEFCPVATTAKTYAVMGAAQSTQTTFQQGMTPFRKE